MLLLWRQLIKCLRRRKKEEQAQQSYSSSDSSDSDWTAGHDCSSEDICSSKDKNIVTSRKYKLIRANNINTVSINVVNLTNIIHSTSCCKVVTGQGITTATSAIPQLRSIKPESSDNSVVWRVLFDSGSDGNLIFLKRSKRHTIDVHKRL